MAVDFPIDANLLPIDSPDILPQSPASDLDDADLPQLFLHPAGNEIIANALVQENPHLSASRLLSVQEVYAASHPMWFVRVIFIIVSLLHTHYRLPFRGCALLLMGLGLIFSTLQLVPPTDPIPKTLHTVFSRLDLGDRFNIHPMCETCKQVFPPNTPTNASCSRCNQPLFRPASTSRFAQLRGSNIPDHTPKLVTPIRLLSAALPEFLNRDGNEQSCESWKTFQGTPGRKSEIWEGEIWKTIRGPDNKPFFDATDDPSELRLGVTISVDW